MRKRCHSRMMLTDELLLLATKLDVRKGHREVWSQHTNVVIKYHWLQQSFPGQQQSNVTLFKTTPSIGNHYYGYVGTIIKIIKIKQVSKRSHQVWPWIIRFLLHSQASHNKLPWKQKFRSFSCRQNLKETLCFSSVFNFQYGVCNELLIIMHCAIRVLHLFTYK